MIGSSFTQKAAAHGFTSNNTFRNTFRKLLQGKAKTRQVKGLDNTPALYQALAGVKGRQNRKRTKPVPFQSPVAAAMQHAVRNRSLEQGGNLSTTTSTLATARNSAPTVRRLFGSGRGTI